LTAKGGGTIAKWKILDDHLTSDTNSITLHSNGTLYSGSHSALANTSNGFYIGSDGLSIGSKFKVTATGELAIGNGATAGNSKHWKINGDSSRSYIAYGDSSNDTSFVAANSKTTNKNQVYIGTDGISLGRRFSVSAAGNLIAYTGNIGSWTIQPGSITYNTTDTFNGSSGIYFGTGGIRLGSAFSVTAGGVLKCSGATVSGTLSSNGGTFTNITASGGTFTSITANGGNFNNITAYGTISSTGGTFTNISATGGTFSNIYASGGTFSNINASGGTFSNINASGATINYLYYGGSYVSWQAINVLTGITAEKVAVAYGNGSVNVVQKLHRTYTTITFLCPSYNSWSDYDYS